MMILTGKNLVGGFTHLEKYEFVNGKDDIPYIMENKTCSKPPTRNRQETPIKQLDCLGVEMMKWHRQERRSGAGETPGFQGDVHHFWTAKWPENDRRWQSPHLEDVWPGRGQFAELFKVHPATLTWRGWRPGTPGRGGGLREIWEVKHVETLFCSPPARWGLLDFIRAVLLLLRLRILLLHLLRLLLLAVQIPVGTDGPPPRAQDPSGHCRTSTATSRLQWALPDLNGEFQIAVGTAGPQPWLPDRSGHCRTSTATSRSQWALPDLNRDFQIAVGTAGPQPRLPDRSGHCRTSTGRMWEDMPDRMSEDMPDRMPERMS